MKVDLPAGFTARPPKVEEAEEVAALRNALHVAEIGQVFTSPDWVKTDWTSPASDLAENERLIFDPDGVLVGSVSAFTHAPFDRVELDGYVHPDHIGRGVGTAILNFGEGRAAEIARAAGTKGAVVVLHSAWHESGPAHDFLLSRGFRPIRRFDDMEIVMSEPPPEPIWPEGITVREFTPGVDERATFEAAEEAFQDHFGWVEMPFEQWLHEDIGSAHFDPTMWFLAMDGDEIAAVCLNEIGRPESPADGWVRDLAVRRPWRRRGLASALLQLSFGTFYARGIKRVGLGVDSESLTGANTLYERLGMRIYRSFTRYQKDVPL